MKVIKKVSAISLILLFSMQPASGMQMFSTIYSGLSNAASTFWKPASSCSSLWSSAKGLADATLKEAKKHPGIALAALATTGTIATVMIYNRYVKNKSQSLQIDAEAPVQVVDGTANNTFEADSRQESPSLESVVAQDPAASTETTNNAATTELFPYDDWTLEGVGLAIHTKPQQQNPSAIHPITAAVGIANTLTAVLAQRDSARWHGNVQRIPAPQMAQKLQAQHLRTQQVVIRQAAATAVTLTQQPVVAQVATAADTTICPSASSCFASAEAKLQTKPVAQRTRRNHNAGHKRILQAAQKDVKQLNVYKQAFKERGQDNRAKLRRLLDTSRSNRSLETAQEGIVTMACNVDNLTVERGRTDWQLNFVGLYLTAKAMIDSAYYGQKFNEQAFDDVLAKLTEQIPTK